MVLEKAVLDVWRRGFLDDIQFDAHAIGAVLKFLDPANVKFDSNDYLTHVSGEIADDTTVPGTFYLGITEFYREIIVATQASTSPANIDKIKYYNHFRICSFLKDVTAPILLFPSIYMTEKEKIADLVSYGHNNEKSLEVLNLLKILTETIASYPSGVGPDEYEAKDMEVVNKLILQDWDTSTWDPTDVSKAPHMNDELRSCMLDIQRLLLIDGLFFNEGLATELLTYWYNCFYSKATSTEAFNFLENEIRSFALYFENAKPSPGASELFNPAVSYIKHFVNKALSRGSLQLISEKSIPATRKMMGRLNFTTNDEISQKRLLISYEYFLLYLLTKGDSKLAELYGKIPYSIWDTVPSAGSTPNRPKPNQGSVDLNNLFPGDFITGRPLSSFSNGYKNHKRLVEQYEQSLKNVVVLKCKISERIKMSERNKISISGYSPSTSGGVIP